MNQRVQFSNFLANKPVLNYNRQPVRSCMPKSLGDIVSFSSNTYLKGIPSIEKEVANMGSPINKQLPNIPKNIIEQMFGGIPKAARAFPEGHQNSGLLNLLSGQPAPEQIIAMQRAVNSGKIV